MMVRKQYKWIKAIYIKHIRSKIGLHSNMIWVWSSKENREKTQYLVFWFEYLLVSWSEMYNNFSCFLLR